MGIIWGNCRFKKTSPVLTVETIEDSCDNWEEGDVISIKCFPLKMDPQVSTTSSRQVPWYRTQVPVPLLPPSSALRVQFLCPVGNQQDFFSFITSLQHTSSQFVERVRSREDYSVVNSLQFNHGFCTIPYGTFRLIMSLIEVNNNSQRARTIKN